jgi:hypothetical protein
MIDWSFGYDGLKIGLNPSARLLWSETSWAMATAVLLFIGIHSDASWLSALAAGVSLWAWMRSHKHYRQIADIPTAKLSAAPQGYIEISGTAESHPDYPVVSPLSGLPCLWFDFTVWEMEGNSITVINSGTSTLPFSLVDGSGHVLVVPEAAQVVSRHNKKWRAGNHKFHERVLLKNETLYVLGDHVSSLRDDNNSPVDRQRNALLAEWKQDQKNLRSRFDSNHDGHIDAAEWDTARQAAESEALLGNSHSSLDEQFIRKPKDGRPFLISNYSAQQLAARFRRWSWLHLGIFFAALAVAIP